MHGDEGATQPEVLQSPDTAHHVDSTVTHRKQSGSTPGEPKVLRNGCRNEETGLPIPRHGESVVASHELAKSEDTNHTTTRSGHTARCADRQRAVSRRRSRREVSWKERTLCVSVEGRKGGRTRMGPQNGSGKYDSRLLGLGPYGPRVLR